MSLPPGFLDELRTRTSLSQVVGRKVMWDQRKSNQGKGDMWAPCPFHHEKSASFHVDDRKGYYYCFGCHAKGDAISFIKDTENVGFMEAVEILAREAGMPIPERDPRAQEKADKHTELAKVMEQAVQFYRLQLKTGAGAPARDYLDKRGLKESTQERFEIGFAPDGWQNLWDHLTGKGVAPDLIIEAGLAKPSAKGGKPYDTFRNRIMFPIRDIRKRCIAFGGRAMDPADNAKYLNSPETPLFDKSRTLYNHAPAREAAGKGAPLIVAEGYMDVIALSEAGFEGSVAPLGTAVTEHQLQMLWRVSDEPVIALDGDTAGLRAAHRVVDIALPLLEAGKSLRFALMPEGKDPDDMIRAEGAGAVRKLVEEAIPMVNLLWSRETEGRVYDSPERKAALDKALREKIKLIRDPSIRSHYGEAIKEMRYDLFRPKREAWAPSGGGQRQGGFQKTRGKGGWQPPQPPVLTETKNSYLAAGNDASQERMRITVILAMLLRHPSLARDFDYALERMDCHTPELSALRHVVLSLRSTAYDAAYEEAAERLGYETLENLLATPHLRIVPALKEAADEDLVRMTLAEELAKLEAHRGLKAEIAEAEEDLAHLADEAVTWRLSQAAAAVGRAQSGTQEDNTEYDLGKNGARISKSEREAFAALMAQIGHTDSSD
ncbi:MULTISPECIES: DNA primase [Lentibacter]|jgi:DNA primase|uniref:DNA primase n=2 Tax=Lentibacter algarum TaxID=576131 RepID=A0A1H3JQ15_9RHOB|nr:DNA primase [Lentibacter algarum]WIF32390.1 DNA primase DnaG [Lentibacter algarum]SDY41679.1 DNA primase [Lentibacter algarum]